MLLLSETAELQQDSKFGCAFVALHEDAYEVDEREIFERSEFPAARLIPESQLMLMILKNETDAEEDPFDH